MRGGDRAHRGIGGDDHDPGRARQQKGDRKEQPAAKREFAAQPDRAIKCAGRSAADGVADAFLGGQRKGIEHERGDGDKLHQHVVGGERDRAQPRAGGGKPAEQRKQRHRADHQVAVDHEQPRQPVARQHHAKPGCTDQPQRTRAAGAKRKRQADHQRQPFGDRGAPADARGAKAKPAHKGKVERDVERVHGQLEHEREPGLAPADQPAVDGKAGKRGRCAEKPRDEKGVGRRGNRARIGQQRQAERDDRRGGNQQHQPDGKAKHQPADQQGIDFAPIARAARLRHQPR